MASKKQQRRAEESWEDIRPQAGPSQLYLVPTPRARGPGSPSAQWPETPGPPRQREAFWACTRVCRKECGVCSWQVIGVLGQVPFPFLLLRNGTRAVEVLGGG